MKSAKYSRRRKRANGAGWWPIIARRVVGGSMAPTLRPGRSVIGLRWFGKLEPGDVVIFSHEGIEKIKRLSAVTQSGDLYVLGEPASASRDSRHFGAISCASVVGKVIWPRIFD